MNRAFLGGAFSIGILVFVGMNTAQAKNWNLGNGQLTEINTPEIGYRTYARLPTGYTVGLEAMRRPQILYHSHNKPIGRVVGDITTYTGTTLRLSMS